MYSNIDEIEEAEIISEKTKEEVYEEIKKEEINELIENVENISDEELEKQIEESNKETEEVLNEAIKSNEQVLKDMDSIIDELEKSEDNDARELADEFKKMREIDKNLAEQFKEFKGILTLGNNGKIDVNFTEGSKKLVKELHQKVFTEFKEKESVKNYVERFLIETEEKDNIYTIQYNEKDMILKLDYFEEIKEESYTDIMGNVHKLLVPNIEKIKKEFYNIYGETPESSDVFDGLVYVYNEIFELDRRIFARDKMLYDYKSSFDKMFNKEEIVEKMVEEWEKIKDIDEEEMSKLEKTIKMSLNFVHDSILKKINKVFKYNREELNKYNSLFLHFYETVNIYIISTNIDEDIKEEDKKEKMLEIRKVTYIVHKVLAKQIKKSSLKQADLNSIPGFVLSLREPEENNPSVKLGEEIGKLFWERVKTDC